uniref:RBR-type E3 ubiquitin transferase n=1 Tax=Amblyomma maculatum TaxID=34609 RepID=G3MS40_AMBMU
MLLPRVDAPGEMEEAKLEHLPPIRVDFELPVNYPSESAPKVCLSCPWLTTRELGVLCNALDRSWMSFRSTVILYHWITLLDSDAACILELKSMHSLGPLCRELTRWQSSTVRWKRWHTMWDDHSFDMRCFKEILDPQCLGPLLTEFNVEEKRRVFSRQWLTCQVCLTCKLGTEFELVVGCDHPFCRECLQQFVRTQIESGSATQLRCPQPDCRNEFVPTQVTALVGEELGARYEERLFNACVDAQDDMTFCPRLPCQRAVVMDPDAPTATCSSCHFSFCVLCRKAYHGVEPCKQNPGGERAIRDKYMAAGPADKQVMEKHYGKHTLQRIVNEMLTLDWIEENSRKCPHCHLVIEKLDGCNKMTCRRCGKHFCWICMVAIDSSTGNPYDHFSNASSKCYNKLFEGAVEPEPVVEEDYEFGEFL